MSRICKKHLQINASNIIISIMVIILNNIIMIMIMNMIVNMIMITTTDIVSSSAVIRYLPKSCNSQTPGPRLQAS